MAEILAVSAYNPKYDYSTNEKAVNSYDIEKFVAITKIYDWQESIAELMDEGRFAGHSLRSGFLTAALLKGASYEKIMEVTGQKDIKTLIRYYRNVEQYEDHAGEELL